MNKDTLFKIGIVIPIYKPGPYFPYTLNAIFQQTRSVDRVVLVDSSPEDWDTNINFCDTLIASKVDYLRISSESFDHGGTRNLGAQRLNGFDAVMFVTQDAILLPDCVEKIAHFIEDNTLVAAFARQIPRDGATELEVFERLYSYPTESKVVYGTPNTLEDVFFSNVCSIVRKDAFKIVGGFPNEINTSEDMVLATRLLKSGFRIGYCSDALVKHSHRLGFSSAFKRYFDIGAMHSIWKEEIPLKNVTSRGISFVGGATRHILATSPPQIFPFGCNLIGKFTGYYIGKRYLSIGNKFRLKVSSNKAFWLKYSNL